MTITVYLNVRRFDISENPAVEPREISVNRNWDFQNLKKELKIIFDIANDDCKVMKLRNGDSCLIPLANLLDGNTPDSRYTFDITNINYSTKKNANLLQDAYLDAVRQKLSNMELRVSQAEVLVPQVQWRRQAHMEETVGTLGNRVAFLDRRIDELMPIQWKTKLPQTMS